MRGIDRWTGDPMEAHRTRVSGDEEEGHGESFIGCGGNHAQALDWEGGMWVWEKPGKRSEDEGWL